MTFLRILLKVVALCCCAFIVTYVCTRGNFFQGADNDATADSLAVAGEANDLDDASAGNHLEFKGVPIDGTLSKFMGRMESKGFEVEKSKDGKATLKGDFAGFKDCLLTVSTQDGQDIVANIAVRFPDQDQWTYLLDDYNNLKDLLTEKYGNPTSCTEKFDTEFYEGKLDDHDKIRKIWYDNCKYVTTFATAKGTVTLRLDHESILHTFVLLTYADKENSAAVRAKALEDL